MPLPVPKYPELILTPYPTLPVSKSAEKLLRQLSDKELKADETYSVTKACLTAPAGKNYLYTLAPYWWECDGKWERRDGQRNPVCDKADGQKQLQSMAQAVHSLSFAAQALGRAEYAERATKLIRTFFLDEETKMCPEVLYSQCCLGDDPVCGDKTFIIASRYLILVSQALRVLQLPDDVSAGMKAWVGAQVAWIDSSKQGADARASGNNITDWLHALYASHLAYLDSSKAQEYAKGVFASLTCKSPAETFAPELERTRPRHYVQFTLEALFILAPIAGNGAPPPEVTAWLKALIEFARTVPAGELEAEREADARYGPALAWFDRLLLRWEGGSVPEQEPDGSAWEGGWNQRARLSWALI
ncbi:hypothetical protein Q8F55_007603 [Vanrija albida]|uniref:Alginate lyase domain-containing protein n=1 Tax=Vanrija albida TaxID=181172 RepID=A0ABR3PU03_9TREE